MRDNDMSRCDRNVRSRIIFCREWYRKSPARPWCRSATRSSRRGTLAWVSKYVRNFGTRPVIIFRCQWTAWKLSRMVISSLRQYDCKCKYECKSLLGFFRLRSSFILFFLTLLKLRSHQLSIKRVKRPKNEIKYSFLNCFFNISFFFIASLRKEAARTSSCAKLTSTWTSLSRPRTKPAVVTCLVICADATAADFISTAAPASRSTAIY